MPRATDLKDSNHQYVKLAAHWRAQIQSGVLRPGDRMPTLAAVRTEFGASRPTVEKAHAILEDEGLIERAHGMSAVVASPRQRRAGVIGLCGNGFFGGGSSYYWSQILAGITSRARETDTQLLLLDGKSRDGWEKVDGILLSGWAEVDFLPFIPAQMPLVSLMVPLHGKAAVWADEYSGARMATEHLLELGHRNIAFLHGPEQDMQERMRGYEDALRSGGIKVRKEWKRAASGRDEWGTTYFQTGRRDMAAWLEDRSARGWNRIGCTALLCHNDETAAGAMHALRTAGVSTPKDVSVIGFDGTDICELSSPSITTVALPLQEIGAAAVELLMRQVEADDVRAEQRVLPVQLQVRESTGALIAK